MQEAGLLVPGRWTAAAYTCLMVALYVAESAIVNLTVHDHAQLDRVTGTQAAPPARPDRPPSAEPGMIPPTIPEIKRLLAALTTQSLAR